MNYHNLEEKLQEHFKNNPKRFKHSIGVSEFAVKLNEKFNFGLDSEKLRITGLLHDVAKIYDLETSLEMLSKYVTNDVLEYYKGYPNVIHAVLGAYLVKDLFGIDDAQIFDAVYFHTTGKANMSKFTEVIYVADVVEYGRTYQDAEYYRCEVLKDFDNGLYEILRSIIEMLEKKNEPIERETFNAYNYYRQKVKGNEI